MSKRRECSRYLHRITFSIRFSTRFEAGLGYFFEDIVFEAFENKALNFTINEGSHPKVMKYLRTTCEKGAQCFGRDCISDLK